MNYNHNITCQINGFEFAGSYSIKKSLIHVYYGIRHTCTQIGGSNCAPQALARILLHELVENRNDCKTRC